MRRFASILAILALTLPLFAHAGHAHTYMGTVTMLHGDDAFMMKTREGKQVTVLVSENTTFAHSDDHPANKSELAVGTRVVVKMSADGKTAASVKLSAPPKKK